MKRPITKIRMKMKSLCQGTVLTLLRDRRGESENTDVHQRTSYGPWIDRFLRVSCMYYIGDIQNICIFFPSLLSEAHLHPHAPPFFTDLSHLHYYPSCFGFDLSFNSSSLTCTDFATLALYLEHTTCPLSYGHH